MKLDTDSITNSVGPRTMREITDLHTHGHLDADTRRQSKKLLGRAAEIFRLRIGQMLDKLVASHPTWSYQLLFCELVQWPAPNRNGLSVFLHPTTSDSPLDHTGCATRMGAKCEPNLAGFD